MEQSLDYMSAQDELFPIMEKLIIKYGNEVSTSEFLKVGMADLNKINLVWFNPETVPSNWVAKTVKTPPYYVCLGVKSLTIICVKEIFENFTPEMVMSVLFHELCHIGFDDKGYYKLISHDIQDFRSLVKEIGLDYENAKKMFGDIV